jgi:hypothetical protein
MSTKLFAGVLALSTACALGPAIAADLPRNPAPNDVELYILSPRDGETVASPVTVRFGLRGMGIAPAGMAMENTGHHHLLIDTGLPPFNLPIPADDKHVHFGKGQTEATVTLAPGRHRLQLLLADHLHIPHDPPVMSKPVTIVVK